MEKEELFKELQERVDCLRENIKKVIVDRDFKYYKYIAGDLRLLLDEKNKGNNLLGRTLQAFECTLIFVDNRPYGNGNLDLQGWKNEFIFFIAGRTFTRIDLIKHVADEKAQHFDQNPDSIHTISQGIKIPFDNPAKNGVADQNVVYITNAARQLIVVLDKQFFAK